MQCGVMWCCVVCGVWFMVRFGVVWCIVYGVWSMVCGVWCAWPRGIGIFFTVMRTARSQMRLLPGAWPHRCHEPRCRARSCMPYHSSGAAALLATTKSRCSGRVAHGVGTTPSTCCRRPGTPESSGPPQLGATEGLSERSHLTSYHREQQGRSRPAP